jgi:hypothetical protein
MMSRLALLFPRHTAGLGDSAGSSDNPGSLIVVNDSGEAHTLPPLARSSIIDDSPPKVAASCAATERLRKWLSPGKNRHPRDYSVARMQKPPLVWILL